MQRRIMYAAAIAAGMVLTAGSSLALADTTATTSATSTTTATTTTTTETTTTPPTTTEPPTVKPWIKVSPNAGTPGTKVTVTAACEDPVINTVFSEKNALTVGALTRDKDGHQPWKLTASATINNVPSGHYAVTVKCGDTRVYTEVQVLARQVVVVPKGPANTGDGSLAAQVAQEDNESN